MPTMANGIANSSCAEPIRDSVDRISFMNGSRLHIGGYIEEVQHSDILSDLSDCAEDLSLDTHIELKQGNGKRDHAKLNQETVGSEGSNAAFESYKACANTRLLDVSSISADNLFKDASIDFEVILINLSQQVF
ncbi:hypothetical protein HPP92_022931 [Vanilla planifolia]|uniref:Uncharacterized protein n=1 Tax=Vanilla planifolia TaxID=51239 RepID=A0A835UFW1_VANPL|nr:hypothetical protein HPP92_022931 [Vanilla planifolia]